MGSLEQQTVLEAFFERSPDAVIVVDGEGRIVSANPATQRLLHHPTASLVGRAVEELVPDAVRTDHRDHRAQFNGEPVVHRMGHGRPLRALRNDGSTIPVEITLLPLPDQGTVRIAAMLRDLRPEEDARRELALWTEVIEASDHGIALTDEAGARFVRVNPAFARMHGWTPDSLTGQPVSVLIPDDQRGRLDHYEEQLRTAGRLSYEDVHRRADGSVFPVHVEASTVQTDQGTACRVVYAVDMTERELEREQLDRVNRELEQANEELIAANDQLAASNQFQQHFVSMVSHELRTPLTMVIGLTETLLTRWDDLDHGRMKPMLEAMALAAQRQRMLLDDLLDVAMIQQGTVRQARLAALPVRAVVDGALAVMPDLTEAIEVDVPHGLLVAVDELRAIQIIVNLLNNSRKYGAAPFVISAREADDHVEIAVRDHGRGVPEGFEQDLFEMFTQAARTGHRRDNGVGLGLHIVRWLVDVHGGSLRYERPTDGPGACFVVTLPRPNGHGAASRQANPGSNTS